MPLNEAELRIQENTLRAEYGKIKPYNRTPKISPHAPGLWINLADFRVIDKIKYRGRIRVIDITIPAGFIFDAASVPRAMLTITKGKHRPEFIVAAMVHDYFYRYAELLLGRFETSKLKHVRKVADLLFFKLLKVYNTERMIARLMKRAVRFPLGGGVAFYKHRRRNKKLFKDQ